MLTSIIIVNYNTGKLLIDCIESVFKFENSKNVEIIIVDNSSGDNSNEIINSLTKKFINVRAVFLEKQSGFSFANNRGIETAKGEYIIIMNPDIIFTEPLINKLIYDFENNSSIGALTPALVGTDGKFQRNYFQRYPTLTQFIFFYSFYSKIFYKFPKLMNRWLENQDIDISQKKLWFVEQIPCAFFMTRKKTLEDTGMMDENIMLFFEDVDLSYRINKEFKLAVDSNISVTHLGGSSFKTADNWQMLGMFLKSMHYYFGKHYGKLRAAVLKLQVYSNSLFILLIETIKGLFGKKDLYRVKKHKNVISILRGNGK